MRLNNYQAKQTTLLNTFKDYLMKNTMNKRMKKHLNKKIIATSILLALSATPVMAEEENAFEKKSFIGFSSGAVGGAIVGGPIGAFIGATVGVLIGSVEELEDDKQVLNSKVQAQSSALNQSQHEQASLKRNLHTAKLEQQRMTQQLTLAKQTVASAETLEKLKLNLQFKINSSDIESHYQQQVEQLAYLVQQNPNLVINLSGFADRNGDEAHNQALSEKRVQSVKALLVANGISEDNISSQALGEQSPLLSEQNFQNDFYDRRVEVKLTPKQVLTASK